MKLSLRDLFWLALLVASLTLWWSEHRHGVNVIGEWSRSFVVRRDWNYPSNTERQRLAAARQLAKLTNEALDERFASLAVAAQRSPEDEPCLAEMARRGMSAELQQHYDSLMAQWERETLPQVLRKQGREPRVVNRSSLVRFPHNLELLTALRQSQNQPDPLRIDMELSDHLPYGDHDLAPVMQATITNVDAGKEAVMLKDGGNDRAGRSERWRILLTDEKGQRVADSNFLSIRSGRVYGGGTYSRRFFGGGPLEYGKQGGSAYVFDMRRYVARPPSGKYQLQVLYHNSVGIAAEQDLTGLIVSKSEPIWVTVKNLDEADSRPWMWGPHPALAIVAACGLLTAMAIGRSRKIARRDLVWIALLTAIALGFWLDSLHQSRQIHRLVPDAHARWTIAPATDPQP